MKIHEIISEQNDELNEAGFGDALSIGAKGLKKGIDYAKSISKSGKAIKSTKGLEPSSVIAKDYRAALKQNMKSYSTSGLKGSAKQQRLTKLALANQQARKAAEKRISTFDKPSLRILELMIGGEFLIQHYIQIEDLDEQYKKFINGDKETPIFGNVSLEEASKIRDDRRNHIIGEAVLAISASTRVASKSFKILESISASLGKLVGIPFGRVGRHFGTLASAPAKLGYGISKLVEGGPIRNTALMLFVQSEAGQNFLKNTGLTLLGDTIGSLSSGVLKLGLDALKLAGIDIGDNALASTLQEPKKSPEENYNDSSLFVKKDPTNPKIIYINNMQITDKDGYQLVGNKLLNDLKNKARLLKKPDPTANIPKKPNKDYNF